MIRSLDDYMEDGRQVGRHLWANSGVAPSDVVVANLYDGLSIHAPLWAEALGFCSEGEGFDFIAAPPMPLNTSSGSLGSGRTHGIAHIMDSVLQVQGRAGARQVPGADCCVAVTNPCDRGSAFVLGAEPLT
jgi:acetyl-CoA acetyltransferase